jgi:hypothetical protein
VPELGDAGRAATRRASQREARHLEIRTLLTLWFCFASSKAKNRFEPSVRHSLYELKN